MNPDLLICTDLLLFQLVLPEYALQGFIALSYLYYMQYLGIVIMLPLTAYHAYRLVGSYLVITLLHIYFLAASVENFPCVFSQVM